MVFSTFARNNYITYITTVSLITAQGRLLIVKGICIVMTRKDGETSLFGSNNITSLYERNKKTLLF